MAHRAHTGPKDVEPETLPGDANPIDAADLVEDIDEHGSIDKLIAETDQGWDIDEQVLTLQQAAAANPSSEAESAASTATSERSPTSFSRPPKGPPPLPRDGSAAPSRSARPRPKAPPPLPGSRSAEHLSVRPPSEMSHPDAIVDLLTVRAAALEPGEDRVGLARALIELAIASEIILGDDARATTHAEAALRVDPGSPAAHAFLRRKKHARSALSEMLDHVEHELSAATSEPHQVELLAEKARLLEAIGGHGPELRATWERALAHAPRHAAALKGLESELVARALASAAAQDWEALAVHLARMADAYATDPALAAWLHVERAHVLERRLGRIDAARGGLERAVELDSSVGPVRDTLVRHVAAHEDWASLVRLLDEEARIETSAGRCARLELDAAMIASARMGEHGQACALLERAAARAPTTHGVDRRVLDELVRLHEVEGHWADAARARRARLRFVTDPAAIAYELRALAAVAEKAGQPEDAIADVQRALALEGTDPTLVDTLDRLLAATGKHEPRIATWLQEAARTEDPARRARSFARAAQICEEIGRHDDAVRHLRSAWVATPGDPELLDALARLLAPTLPEPAESSARSLVELYVQAADRAPENGRKMAYLEKAALLWEELLGDPARAARAYELVLTIDQDRRSAILGLERTSARSGNGRLRSRALLDEARMATDRQAQLSLRTRAAAALAKHDPSRASRLVHDVLEADPAHPEARALETRLEEDAGRWERAARSLRARIDHVSSSSDKVALWLALATMQQTRLHVPLDALRSLEEARALDPAHAVPAEEIARLLEDHGDARTLRDAIERLAANAQTPEERARHLARAAEIDELRLNEDANAVRTYQRALAEAPDDALVAERLTRVVARIARRGHGGEASQLAALLSKRAERAGSPSVARAMSFDLAALLVEIGQEPARAISLLEGVIVEQGDHVPALRTLEALRRRAGEQAPLARVLAKQGECLKDVHARLGALWNLVALEEWTLPVGDPVATYEKILELDPTDPAALEATLRRELPNARRGDPRARTAAIEALRSLVAFASDVDTRLALELDLALLLETAAVDSTDGRAAEALSHEALDRYRSALRVDELSMIAATGVARLAEKLHEPEAGLAAARSLAQLASEPRLRARYLVEAAELLGGPEQDARLGTRADRQKNAANLLEQALEADADSIAAAGRLATLLLESSQGERLVSTFRDAVGRARTADAVVMLGSEIARVARDELKDLNVAIDAMQRVRAVAPQHVPSLLTLAELCIAQRVWPEAVDALEAVVSTCREVPPKLTALFALASIYEKVLAQPEDVDRVLRAALALDAFNARALRALLRRVASEPADRDDAATRARRREMASLLDRLADVEKEPEQKTATLLELSEVHVRLGDMASAERALVEAVARSPSNARAFTRLSALFRRAERTDHVGHARALTAVVAMGQQIGHLDARWFAALGQIEIHNLSRSRDGIGHLQRAVALDPTLYETRFELATALTQGGANDEATRVLVAMLSPNPPSATPVLAIADPSAAIALLEKTLTGERRPDEAVVASELRAIAGELDDGRRSWLRARRLPHAEAAPGGLQRQALVTHVLPAEGRHILLEVAAAIAGIEAKLLRGDLGEIGLSPRDRIGPRAGHPTRVMLDRVARQLGVEEVELAISPRVARVRVLAQDVPWIVIPPTFVQRDESSQIAGLARVTARIAYGTPWIDELTPEASLALLVAGARQVVPKYGPTDGDAASAKLVAQHEATLSRVLNRRQRKLLEELAPHLVSGQGRLPPAPEFARALARAELRTAFVMTGDLLATVAEIRTLDAVLDREAESPGARALAAILDHALAGDVARFALTPEATTLRRRLGSTWTR